MVAAGSDCTTYQSSCSYNFHWDLKKQWGGRSFKWCEMLDFSQVLHAFLSKYKMHCPLTVTNHVAGAPQSWRACVRLPVWWDMHFTNAGKLHSVGEHAQVLGHYPSRKVQCLLVDILPLLSSNNTCLTVCLPVCPLELPPLFNILTIGS